MIESPGEMTSDRQRPYRLAVAVTTAVLLGVIALATAPTHSGAHLWKNFTNASGHTVTKWYFRGTTVGDGPEYDPIDPVTLIFHGGSDPHIYTNQFITNRLETFIPDMKVGCLDPTCLIHINCNGRQRMYWTDLNGGHNSDKEDINRSTSDSCEDQVHIRLWDDHEHAKLFPNGTHQEFNWIVGSVHKEHRCPVPGVCHHDLDSSFEVQARTMAAIWDAQQYWCADPKWHALPGSAGGKGRHYSDGYLTEIIHNDTGC